MESIDGDRETDRDRYSDGDRNRNRDILPSHEIRSSFLLIIFSFYAEVPVIISQELKKITRRMVTRYTTNAQGE